jgi:putative transposase
VKATVHRLVEGRMKTISIKREGSKLYLFLSCDDVPEKALAPTGAGVGTDIGITSFIHLRWPSRGQPPVRKNRR